MGLGAYLIAGQLMRWEASCFNRANRPKRMAIRVI